MKAKNEKTPFAEQVSSKNNNQLSPKNDEQLSPENNEKYNVNVEKGNQEGPSYDEGHMNVEEEGNQAKEGDKEDEKSKTKVIIDKVLTFIRTNYLPISCVFAVILGVFVPWPGAAINHAASQYLCVIGIFLYSGMYLRTSAIKEAIRAVLPLIWGVLSILCLTCIIGGQLTLLLPFDKTYTVLDNNNIPSQIDTNHSFINQTVSQNKTKTVFKKLLGPTEFKTGFLVYVCMPCTISSGLVMVTQLEGNFALGLLLTVVTNIGGIFTMPFFLKWMLTLTTKIQLDVGPLLLKLCLTVLLPIVIGKALRCVNKIKTFVTVPARKNVLSIINITLLVAMFWMKISTTSLEGELHRLTVLNALFIIGWSLLIHITFLLLNTLASLILRFKTDQKKTIIVLASHKSLAVAISISSFLPKNLGDQGLIVIPMVISHITLIIFDVILIPIWLSLERRSYKPID